MFSIRALDEPAGGLTVAFVGHHKGRALLPACSFLQLAFGFVRFAIGATDRVVESNAHMLRYLIAKVEIIGTHSTPTILCHVEHLLQMWWRLPSRDPCIYGAIILSG